MALDRSVSAEWRADLDDTRHGHTAAAGHSRRRARRAAAALVLAWLAQLAIPAAAQVEYQVTDLGLPGDAFESLATGIDNHGRVVGWSGHSFGESFFRSWMWSPEGGLVQLPPIVFPNGDTNHAAMDINDAGVIAGDGSGGDAGGSGGRAWLFADGAYTVLPLLPGHTWAGLTGVNAFAEVVGFGDDFSIGGSVPEQHFYFSEAAGLVLIPETAATIHTGKINDAGEVVGTTSFSVFRWTPQGGFEFLAPPPPPFNGAFGKGINDAGQVCGTLHEGNDKHGAVYTDGQGWQPIADFALAGCCSDPRTERAEAINESGVAVGWSALNGGELSGHHVAWVWSEEQGARLLDDLVDPALNVRFSKALDINDAGQIAAYGSDDDLSTPYRAFLLTPIPPTQPACQADLGFGGPGALTLSLCGQPLADGGTARLTLAGAPPAAPVFLSASLTLAPTPLAGGTIVTLPIAVLVALTASPAGSVQLEVPGGGGPATLYVQGFALDPQFPKSLAISNALRVELLP